MCDNEVPKYSLPCGDMQAIRPLLVNKQRSANVSVYFVTNNGEVLGARNKRYPRKLKKKLKGSGQWIEAHDFKGIKGKILDWR
jgi:hypothetical protein